MAGLRFLKHFSISIGLKQIVAESIFEEAVKSRKIGYSHEQLIEKRNDRLFSDWIERAILILYIIREDEMAERAHSTAT